MITRLKPRLVTAIPEQPEAGVFYVSVEYATTLHLCACGCGQEVVLGISPNDWKVCWDGLTISVSPSVGNWSLPCRSHYVIRHNRIQWAKTCRDEEIARTRAADLRRKRLDSGAPTHLPTHDTDAATTAPDRGWRRLLRVLRTRRLDSHP
jgi:hypothetical protein